MTMTITIGPPGIDVRERWAHALTVRSAPWTIDPTSVTFIEAALVVFSGIGGVAFAFTSTPWPSVGCFVLALVVLAGIAISAAKEGAANPLRMASPDEAVLGAAVALPASVNDTARNVVVGSKRRVRTASGVKRESQRLGVFILALADFAARDETQASLSLEATRDPIGHTIALALRERESSDTLTAALAKVRTMRPR